MLNEGGGVGKESVSQPASADDFLPVFILIVLKAQPQRLYASLEYIASFRRPAQLCGERHYYLVQLQTAVAFLEHMDGAAVSMEVDEFEQQLQEREQLWESRAQGRGAEQEGAEDESVHVAREDDKGVLSDDGSL
eukprot:1262874-Rhodomonas_salina.3